MSILSAFLEIAIVLAAIYVSLSCVCSAVNEQIASFLKLRGAKLYQGVLNLLAGNRILTDMIFKHPMIAASIDDKNGAIDPEKSYRPSYVDARTFSMAFWQSVRSQHALPTGAAAAIPGSSGCHVFDDIALRVGALPEGDLQRSLAPLVDAASGDYDKLLAATDGWFNAQMDRVSGWYKRQSQAFLAVIAAAIVLASGIDSIEIGSALYFDQGLRQRVVDSIAKSLPTQRDSSGSSARSTTPQKLELSDASQKIDEQLQAQLGRFFHSPTDWLVHFRHIPGMVVTFLALLLGGPFWFDALCGLVNVRLAGRKPQRSDQPPK